MPWQAWPPWPPGACGRIWLRLITDLQAAASSAGGRRGTKTPFSFCRAVPLQLIIMKTGPNPSCLQIIQVCKAASYKLLLCRRLAISRSWNKTGDNNNNKLKVLTSSCSIRIHALTTSYLGIIDTIPWTGFILAAAVSDPESNSSGEPGTIIHFNMYVDTN
jgi:hypothetical protein